MAGWIILASGSLFLLVAAMNARTSIPCAAVEIKFRNAQGEKYVSRASIARALDDRGSEALKGRSVREMDLLEMEKRLERDPWIKNAELYMDGKHVLHVTIVEQTPLARVFTASGESFYIDSGLNRIPLNERYTPRLPVFTGLTLGKYPWGSRDSLKLSEVREIVKHMTADSFWMAQIEQSDLDPQYGFIMIPKIGEHRIIFGEGKEVAQKFHNLLVFYRQVLSRTGWSSYATVDLRFAGQVVAVPAGKDPLSGQVIDDAVAGISGHGAGSADTRPSVEAVRNASSRQNIETTGPAIKETRSTEGPKPKAVMPPTKKNL